MKHDVEKGRVVKKGNSWAVILPPQIRQRMLIQPGDLILMSLWGDLLIMRRATRRTILPIENIPPEVVPGQPI